jgi:glycosyltransferase involved in cell wall biosynthesis
VLGHLSNLSRAKGLYDVMDAFDSVRAVDPGARLRIAGGASDPAESADLTRFCQRHGDAVDWIGPVPNSDVAAFMAEIDLLLFPSRYANEAQPLVVLEAMRAGTPVAAYDIGELANCIGSGGAVCDESASFPNFVTKLVQADKMETNHLRQLGQRAARQFDQSLRASEVELMQLADDLLSNQG